MLHKGRLLGVVPKSFLPNYKEFYEARWFAPAVKATQRRDPSSVAPTVPFGTDQLFAATDVDGLIVGVEICEDLWVPSPPSSAQALAGATVLVNLSASNEVIGKASYRRQLVLNQSGRCMAAYVYASCGVGESTTDLVFGGHCLIAENGTMLAESRRFQREDALLVADVDLDRLRADRQRHQQFPRRSSVSRPRAVTSHTLTFALGERPTPTDLRRPIEAHPFVPQGKSNCASAARRFSTSRSPGWPSASNTSARRPWRSASPADSIRRWRCWWPARPWTRWACRVRASWRSRCPASAPATARATTPAPSCASSASPREVDIRPLCLEEMRVLGHRPFGIDLTGLSVEELTERLRRLTAEERHDLVFENVQARMRTSLLMNSGFVIGTGDVSEAALGWSTYNGDHMSMYNPNSSIPKTLVKFLVDWAARNEFEGEARRTLLDIVDTLISPELLPFGADGQPAQATEGTIGPYEVLDFFLFHFLRYGAPPEKILFLAERARFLRSYSCQELRGWLKVFIAALLRQSVQTLLLPDGPKVGTISLSPRGDWRMPSDAQAALWLRWADS